MKEIKLGCDCKKIQVDFREAKETFPFFPWIAPFYCIECGLTILAEIIEKEEEGKKND